MGSRVPLPKEGSKRWRQGVFATHNNSAPPENGDVTMPPAVATRTAAKEHWLEIAPLLIADGRLKPSSVPPFAMLCQLHAEIVAAEALVKKGGAVSRNGRISAAATLLRQHRRYYFEVAKQFAMTPMASNRMPVAESTELDEDQALLKKFTA